MSNKEMINEDEIVNEDNGSNIWKDAFDAAKMFEGEKKEDITDVEAEVTEAEEQSNKTPEAEETPVDEPVKAKKESRENGHNDSDKGNHWLKEISYLKSRIEEKEVQFKRLAADFDNYRRRQDLEKEELLKYGSEKAVLEILPSLDNFERAIESSKNASDVNSIISGIEMIQKQLIESLKKQGVELIEAMEAPFDPNFHEAVQQMVDNDKPDQTVIHEIRKGYTLNGRVIRPSMVVVSTISEE